MHKELKCPNPHCGKMVGTDYCGHCGSRVTFRGCCPPKKEAYDFSTVEMMVSDFMREPEMFDKEMFYTIGMEAVRMIYGKTAMSYIAQHSDIFDELLENTEN